MTKTLFGQTPDGAPVDLYTIKNAHGMTAKVMNYGGIITELHVPDRSGKIGDVVLGFNSLDKYSAGHPYFGAIIGRVGNRIGNGSFTLDGRTYSLAINTAQGAHLHGGMKGYDKVLWKVESIDENAIKLTYHSHDGEEGYPGALDIAVVYTITDDNALRIDYAAIPSIRATPVNLTQHSYFNLAGEASGKNVLDHEMMIAANHYTPMSEQLVPNGEIKPVAGTPYDFTKPTKIGAHNNEAGGNPAGYDINYALNSGGSQSPTLAARVYEPTSGRVMEVLTTEPGVQLYVGVYLDGKLTGKGGTKYQQYSGFCLETQHFPDALNKPNFASIVVRPGETYHSSTVYRFSTRAS
jgi:aldose 1-epimerase